MYRKFHTGKRESPFTTEIEGSKGKERYYTTNLKAVEQLTGLSFPYEDWKDGVTLIPKMGKVHANAKDYTHEVPMDKRTTCATCSCATGHKDVGNGLYRCWCREAFTRGGAAWKQEPHELEDNHCRDWIPANQDCIG